MRNPVSFIHDLKFSELSPEVTDNAVRALTDTLGVGIAASKTKLSRIIHDHAAGQFGPGSNMVATLWQDGRKVSPAGAALANGMTIDALDAHDGQKLTKGHVGCGVVPSLIAMMEATGTNDGEELLTALVMGYEIGTRAGISLHSTVSDYHTSGAWIALATAAIGARFLRLNHEQTRHALGIAEYHGPRSQMMRTIDHPTMVKDGSGWGAMAGVSAAYLASEGFTGAPAISMEAPEVSTVWNDLGEHWYVNEQYIKMYPVCRWAQPPVEAALALQQQYNFDYREITAIEVATFHEATRLSTRHPIDTEQAQYSLPFPVAAALIHGTIGADEVSDDALADPEAIELREKIEMIERDEFNREFPQHRIAQVKITLNDGRALESAPTEAIGDPENPVSRNVIEDKFQRLTSPVIGEDKSISLLNNLTALKSGGGLASIIDDLSHSPV